MKKLILLSAAAVMFAVTVNAQITSASLKSEIEVDKKVESNIRKEQKEYRKEIRKLRGNEVSYQGKQAFARDFTGVSPMSTEKLGSFDKFTFIKDGQTISAYYDWDSELVGTTQNKTFSDLPAKARIFINEKYAGYAKEGVLFFNDNEMNETDMVLYGNQFADEDSYFVELQKDNMKIVVHVNMDGDVEYYTRLR